MLDALSAIGADFRKCRPFESIVRPGCEKFERELAIPRGHVGRNKRDGPFSAPTFTCSGNRFKGVLQQVQQLTVLSNGDDDAAKTVQPPKTMRFGRNDAQEELNLRFRSREAQYN